MSYTVKRIAAEAKRIVPIDRYSHIFQQDIIYGLLREAQKQVMLECKSPVERKTITIPVAAVSNERTINLPDKFLEPITDGIRIKEPGDNSLGEGLPLTIRAYRDLDSDVRP